LDSRLLSLPGALADRFSVERVLQEREHAAVFCVRDRTAEGCLRTLKLVSPRRSEVIDELAAEFRLLKGVRHPHLTAVLEFDREEDRFWLLREFVDGPSLASLDREMTPDQRRAVFADLLRGLGHLHARGLLHLDLKPENILLRQEGADFRGVLTDFGFAARNEVREVSGEDPVRGTPLFVAPEVLLGLKPDARSDLFSLGVALVATLPGVPDLDPGRLYTRFPGVSFAEALDLDLETLGGDLGSVLVRLLATNPDSRPRSAAAVLAELEPEGATEPDPLTYLSMLRPPPAFVTDPLAGRLEQFLHRPSHPVLWLEAQNAPEAREVLERGRYQAALARLQLRDLSAEQIAPESSTEPVLVQRRQSAKALNRARQILSNGERALVLAPIGREADELAAAAVAAARILLDPGPSRSEQARLLIVSDRHLEEPLRKRLIAAAGEPLCLEGLSREGLVAHLQQLEGRGAAEGSAAAPRLARLAQALLEACGEDPDRIESVLSQLVRKGDAPVCAGNFDFSGVEPEQLLELARDREGLESLGRAALEVLALLDLLDGGVPLHDLLELLEAAQEEALDPLLRRRRISYQAGGQVRIERSGLGRAAFALLDASMRSELASRILAREGLETWKHPLVLAVAGRTADALDLLREEHSLLRSLEASRVTRLLEDLANSCVQDPGALRSARELLSEHLIYSGQLERAAALCEELLAEPEIDRAGTIRMLSRAATIDLMASRLDQAEDRFRKARRKLRKPGAKTLEATRLEVERGLGFARFLKGDAAGAMRSLDAARRSYLDEGREVPHWIQILLGTFAFRAGSPDRAREELAKGLAAARAHGDLEAVASALTNQATLLMGEGSLEQARQALEEARAIRAKLSHPFEEAVILSNLGILLRDSGELAEAAHHLREAARLQLGLGDSKGHAIALSNLSSVEGLGGNLAGGLLLLSRAIEILSGLGARVEERLSRCRLAELLIEAGLERAAREALPEQAEPDEAARLSGQILLCRALFELRFGQPEDGLPKARDAASQLKAAGDLAGAARALLVLARILVRCGSWPAARRHLNEARRFAPPRLEAELLLLQAELAAGLCAQEEALALLGRARDAARRTGQTVTRVRIAAEWVRLARQAAPSHVEQGLRELSLSLAGVKLPPDEAGEERTAVVRLLGTQLASGLDMPIQEPDAAAPDPARVTTEGVSDEVFRTFVALNRSLSREQEASRLLERLLEHAVSLSGGHRGFLLLLTDGQVVFETRSGDVDPSSEEVSRSIVLEAIRERRPLLTSNASSDQRLRDRHSIQQLDLRSVLCVPFRTSKGAEGAIYVDNPIREGAFSARSVDLIEALAGQAAIAISNLERREEIERLNRELEQRAQRSERELVDLRQHLEEQQRSADQELIGHSESLADTKRLAVRFAKTDMPVLIYGESGTGKELLARLTHQHSARADQVFVAENCSAVPEPLMESEFFGHLKGAFTGADRDREGLFVTADRGTLFLDEVGDMPPGMQTKLLRVLQEGKVRPVGSMEDRPVDVRLICATHRDLQQMVREGTFREDLYYRIRGATLTLPPLRERLGDIPLLAGHFVAALNREAGGDKRLSKRLVRDLMRHHWPGNVRELQSEVTRLYHLAEGDLVEEGFQDTLAAGSFAGGDETRAVTQVKPIMEIEKDAIRLALEQTGGNRDEAARRLSISRATFYVKLKKYGLNEEVPSSRSKRPS